MMNEAQFWAKIEVGDKDVCWPWKAALSQGYGRFRKMMAHRISYELLVGPIPPGLTIDHLCRNRACVNPAHLEPVTNRVNVLRGDTIPARELARTHCPQGHPLAAGNLVASQLKRGWRNCLTCRLAQERVRDAKRRAAKMAAR